MFFCFCFFLRYARVFSSAFLPALIIYSLNSSVFTCIYCLSGPSEALHLENPPLFFYAQDTLQKDTFLTFNYRHHNAITEMFRFTQCIL